MFVSFHLNSRNHRNEASRLNIQLYHCMWAYTKSWISERNKHVWTTIAEHPNMSTEKIFVEASNEEDMCAFVMHTKLNTHMHPAWKAHIALRLNNVILKHIQMNAFKRWTTTCNSDVFSCDSHKFSLTLVRVFFGFCMLNYARFCYANEWAIWACSWHVGVCVCAVYMFVCVSECCYECYGANAIWHFD